MNLFKYVPAVSVLRNGVALFVKDPMNPSSIYSWVVSLLSLFGVPFAGPWILQSLRIKPLRYGLKPCLGLMISLLIPKS